MTIAIVCELLGIPLLEHIYIDGASSKGWRVPWEANPPRQNPEVS
jgi:hypothetical protein